MKRGEVSERFKGPFGKYTITRYSNGSYKNIKKACDWYNRCPITFRCEVKSSKYERCRNCDVKAAYHTTENKNMMITKENRKNIIEDDS